VKGWKPSSQRKNKEEEVREGGAMWHVIFKEKPPALVGRGQVVIRLGQRLSVIGRSLFGNAKWVEWIFTSREVIKVFGC